MKPFRSYQLILATIVTAALLALHHSGLVEAGKPRGVGGPAYALTNLVPLSGMPQYGQVRGITNPDPSGVVHVAGFSGVFSGGGDACVWSVSQTGADLATNDLGAYTFENGTSAINNSGVVVGSDPSLPAAFVDFPGTGAGTGMYPLPFSRGSIVVAVNDPDVDGNFSIVGNGYDRIIGSHGLLWDVTGPDAEGHHAISAPIDLGTFLPNAINDLGVMAGHQGGFPAIATLDMGTLNNVVTPLSLLVGDTGGAANGINNRGDVVGVSGSHVVVWSPPNWSPVALKMFGNNVPQVPYDINEAGQVVGYAYTSWPPTKSTLMIGVLWENGAVYDLNVLAGVATTGKQRHISWATAINDIGQISVVMSADFHVDDSLPAVLTRKP